jgi:glycosyltransferase involved in cell wall biosynthesis
VARLTESLPATGDDARRPLVSAIIPTRNRQGVVPVAVRSVLRQTYRPLELVVVDDESLPAVSLDGLRSGDVPVRLVRLDPAEGAGPARNRGVREAAGRLIAFLDDDDEWRPDKIERQVAALTAAGDGVAGVDCGYEMWDGRRLHSRYRPDPGRDLRTALLSHPTMCPSAVMLRRESFLAADGFDASMQRAEDWDLWVRIADRADVQAMPEVLVDRRFHDPPPDVNLASYRRIVEVLKLRIDRLDGERRRRVDATHQLNLGVLLARSGERAEARRALLRAWRLQPRGIRPLVQLGRTMVGDRAWERLAAALRPARAAFSDGWRGRPRRGSRAGVR